jgi:hypothetical protein
VQRAIARVPCWAGLGALGQTVWPKALLWEGSHFQITAKCLRGVYNAIISHNLGSGWASLHLRFLFLYREEHELSH